MHGGVSDTMPRSYWRVIPTIVGLLAVTGSGYVTYKLYEANEQHHADYHYQPAGKPSFVQVMPSKTMPRAISPTAKIRRPKKMPIFAPNGLRWIKLPRLTGSPA